MAFIWTKEELAILDSSDNIGQLGDLLPRRTLSAIRKKKGETRKWSEEELAHFPQDIYVTRSIRNAIAEKLGLDNTVVWMKMSALGYKWVKFEEPTEENPYPMQGLTWENTELAHFPENKVLTQEDLEEVCSKIYRTPSAILSKMRSLGYSLDSDIVEKKEPTKDKHDRIIALLEEQNNMLRGLFFNKIFETTEVLF